MPGDDDRPVHNGCGGRIDLPGPQAGFTPPRCAKCLMVVNPACHCFYCGAADTTEADLCEGRYVCKRCRKRLT